MKMIVEFTLFGIFSWYLLRAAAQDLRCRMVRRYLWWVAGGAGWILFLMKRGVDLRGFAVLAGCWVLQYLLFARFYGRADSHAFFCCAILLTAYGGGITEHLWHALLTFCFLGIVQILRKNVNDKGNLKVPVAFVPYVVSGFYPCFVMLVLKKS